MEARFDTPQRRRGFSQPVRRLHTRDLSALRPPAGQTFCGLIAYEAGLPGEGLQLPDEAPWIIGGFFDREHPPEPDAQEPPPSRPLHFTPSLGRAVYMQTIERVREHIRAGDVYQLNLAETFTAPRPADFSGPAVAAALRACNPAPYGGYLADAHADLFFTCASPETFLTLSADGHCRTRPIKGTAPLHAAEVLLCSEKDRAENVMIVDLMRNDFSRVCRPGTVQVPELCGLETFATLHHLVSTVTGQLASGHDIRDLLRACLPPGSVTGAPKRRAAELIAAAEGRPRGFFCGAFGTIEADGSAEFCVAIRTLIVRGGEIRVQAGSGITLASDPAAEYDEVLLKAAPALRACGGVLPE